MGEGGFEEQAEQLGTIWAIWLMAPLVVLAAGALKESLVSGLNRKETEAIE
jgi:hypothetical protein